MPIRTVVLEVDRRTVSAESAARWFDVASRIQMVCNRYLTAWEQYHEQAGSREQLAEWLRFTREWHQADKSTRGKKPSCPVKYDTKELRQLLRRLMADQGLQVNKRIVELLMNWLSKTMTTSTSGLAKWIRALLHRDRLSRFTHALPIPLDGRLAKVEIRKGEKCEELWVTVKVNRIDTGKARSDSTEDAFRLVAGGKVARYATPVWAIPRATTNQQGQLKSAKLIWNEPRRKWQLAVCVNVPDSPKPEVDDSKTAVVYPGNLRPVLMRIDGRTRPVTGRGYHVAMVRGNIQKQRLGRQHNYRTAIGRGKGRGRKRALESWEGKLARKWAGLCKDNNEKWSQSVIDEAVKTGCGRIVVIQPSLADRFLDVAGNIQPDKNRNGWPWYKLIEKIQQKGQRLGLAVEVVDEVRIRRKCNSTHAKTDQAADSTARTGDSQPAAEPA